MTPAAQTWIVLTSREPATLTQEPVRSPRLSPLTHHRKLGFNTPASSNWSIRFATARRSPI